MQGLVGNEEVQQREYDINNLQAYNPFKNSESSDNIRNSYISEKGVDYFGYMGSVTDEHVIIYNTPCC